MHRLNLLLRWLALCLAVICIAGHFVTRWYRLDAPLGSLVGWPRLNTAAEYGRLVIVHNTPEAQPFPWRAGRISDAQWVLAFDMYDTDWFVLLIPFWAPAAVFSLLAAALWWRPLRTAARRRRGACTACGYDLRALPAATCPECGKPHQAGGRA